MTPVRRTAARLLIPTALAFAIALLTTSTAGAVGTPYFTSFGGQETILSEMAIHPSAVRVGTVTYLAFQGPGYDPYVASYDESSGVWAGPFRAGRNPLRLDAHGAPALLVDTDGYLHVFYGCHTGQMLHAVSAAPGDASRWIQLGSPTMSATYSQPIALPDGKVLLFYRQNGYDFSISWVVRTSDDGGRTWRPGSSQVLAGAANTWYAHFAIGASGVVHCAFTLSVPSSGDTYLGRYNAYYIYRDLSGVWRNANGKATTMPVTEQTANKECLVYDSGTAAVNEIVVKEEPTATPKIGAKVQPIVTPDASASVTPLVEFLTGSGRGADRYAWKFARHNGTAWDISEITRTDHDFDAATFDPHTDGTIDSYLVTGGSDEYETRPFPTEGRGGRIERWRSTDRGASWAFGAVVSPDETSTLFSDPQIVENASDTSKVMFTEWTNDKTDFFHRIYLYGANGFVTRPTASRIDRVSGHDRIGTAIAVSKTAFPEGSNVVVLATAYDFPDALAAGPLAQALGGPILLVPPNALPSAVAAEIRRLGVTRVVVLGSGAAVSNAVITGLFSAANVTSVERIAGRDRYQTAQRIATKLGEVLGPLRRAVIVSGKNYPDGLSAGPLAAWRGYPIILASGDQVPNDVAALLRHLAVTSTVVVGSPSAVSDAYANSLPAPTRIDGPDRFSTAAALARYALSQGLLPDRIVVASGYAFPDGLTGSTLAARTRAPLLLAAPSALTTPTVEALSEVASHTVQAYVLGGPDSIGSAPVAQAGAILGASFTGP